MRRKNEKKKKRVKKTKKTNLKSLGGHQLAATLMRPLGSAGVRDAH